MKLYVWHRWCFNSYFPGKAFAIASTENKAKKAVINGDFYLKGCGKEELGKIEWEGLKTYPLDKSIGFNQGGGN